MIYEIYTENGTKKKRALTGNGYGLPLGTVIAYEGSVPDGFLACDGSAYNTTTYSALYALLGVNTTPNLTSQNMTNTDGWCIKATPAYVEPDTVSDMVHTMRVQDSYSTEEVNTGKTWIDGKPIYSRVLQGNVIPVNGTTAIGNVSKIIKQEGYLKDNNIWYIESRNEFNLTLNEQTHNVEYYFRYNAGLSYDWYFTIEYTKTTD